MNCTVGVLLYGDYPHLARRCLSPLLGVVPPHLLRVGMNAVCDETRHYVESQVAAGHISQSGVWDNRENRRKYPVLRQVLWEIPVTTPWWMWFDDDSFVRADDVAAWFGDVLREAPVGGLLGSVYTIPLKSSQVAWVQSQPWYCGKAPLFRGNQSYATFCTGGWWVADTAMLYRYNYPWPELYHNGGDVMLGEMCRQQGLPVVRYDKNVAVNADAAGRNSRAARRGDSTPPIGV